MNSANRTTAKNLKKYSNSALIQVFAALFALNVCHASKIKGHATEPICVEYISHETPTPEGIDLFKTINALRDGASIPKELYDKFSVNELGRALKQRIAHQELEFTGLLDKENGNIPLDLKKDTDVILFFESEQVDSYADNGFLNQHQTHRSNEGNYDPDTRRTIETAFTGIDLGSTEKSNKIRPKYAFLNIRADLKLSKMNASPSCYGNIGAVLNDEILDRSTWTSGDSYYLYNKGAFNGAQNKLKSVGTFSRNALPNKALDSNYYEVQIYGEISMDDVNYFLVQKKDEAETLKHLGHPVYLADVSRKNDRIIYKKGELLYAGGPPLMADNLYKTSEKTEFELIKNALKAAGILEIPKDYSILKFFSEYFKRSYLVTNGLGYYIYNPYRNIEKFHQYRVNMFRLLTDIENRGFKVRKLIYSDDQVVIQEGTPPGFGLGGVSFEGKKIILENLKKLILKMINEKIYLEGLAPSVLSVDSHVTRNLIIENYDGLKEHQNLTEVLLQVEEKMLPLWREYFTSGQNKELQSFLNNVKNDGAPSSK